MSSACGGCPEMLAYIVSGLVALAVTGYLFVALLFPERF
jgi:K+-transporting ATPase KdpF subunit